MLPWIWLRCGPQCLYLSVQFLSKLPGMTPGITLLKSTSNSSRRYISSQRNAVSEARSVGKLSHEQAEVLDVA